MHLHFDSLEEVMDFASRFGGDEGTEPKTRRTRKTKSDTAGGAEAPEPAGIPNGGSPSLVPSDGAQIGNGAQITTLAGPVFTPPAGNAFPGGAATGAVVAAPTIDPAVGALVTRISARIDAAAASGQSTGPMLDWFRTHCGPDAAQASLDQIKQAALPKLPLTKLEEIAKLMNA